jgi:hypothetical protein
LHYSRNEIINIGFCDKYFPLEGKKWLGNEKNSIGIWRKGGIRFDASLTEYGGYEFFKKGDFVGIGIIHQPNSSLKCFCTCNGEFLGKKLQFS